MIFIRNVFGLLKQLDLCFFNYSLLCCVLKLRFKLYPHLPRLCYRGQDNHNLIFIFKMEYLKKKKWNRG